MDEALAVIAKALDYVCAESVHGSLLSTLELTVHHGELALSPHLRALLTEIGFSLVGHHAPGPAGSQWISAPLRLVYQIQPLPLLTDLILPPHQDRPAWAMAPDAHLHRE